MRLKGLDQLEKQINNLIGNQTRDLPACSIMSRPNTLPRAPFKPTRFAILMIMCIILVYYAFSFDLLPWRKSLCCYRITTGLLTRNRPQQVESIDRCLRWCLKVWIKTWHSCALRAKLILSKPSSVTWPILQQEERRSLQFRIGEETEGNDMEMRRLIWSYPYA
jgi:hypothetical protein